MSGPDGATVRVVEVTIEEGAVELIHGALGEGIVKSQVDDLKIRLIKNIYISNFMIIDSLNLYNIHKLPNIP